MDRNQNRILGILGSHPDLATDLPKLLHWEVRRESLPLALAHGFVAVHPKAALLNLYGSVEVTGDVTCFDIKRTLSTGPAAHRGHSNMNAVSASEPVSTMMASYTNPLNR